MTPQQAQRWLATELLLAAIVRTVTVIRDNDGGIPAPTVFIPLGIGYGILALGADFEVTAKASAYLGALILFTMVLYPAKRKDGSSTTTGGNVLTSLGSASNKVTQNPPSYISQSGANGQTFQQALGN